MANAVYPSWLDALLAVTLGHTIKASILGPGYTYSSAHTAPSDLTDVLGTVTLTLTSTAGVIDAEDSVVSSPTVESMKSVAVYDDTASKLMLFFDTGVGFQANPSGDVTIIWPNDANVKIFPLGGKP